jgi:hypothetical protein
VWCKLFKEYFVYFQFLADSGFVTYFSSLQKLSGPVFLTKSFCNVRKPLLEKLPIKGRSIRNRKRFSHNGRIGGVTESM